MSPTKKPKRSVTSGPAAIRAAAKHVAGAAPKRPKSNRTLSLDHERFEAFAALCHDDELKASNVVDDLIAAYLEARNIQ